jgi:hypothetical protein
MVSTYNLVTAEIWAHGPHQVFEVEPSLKKWPGSGDVANREANQINQFGLKAYICRVKSSVVLHIFCFHAQISAVTKLYVLTMDTG